MGDSLEENFQLGGAYSDADDQSSPRETLGKAVPKKKRNLRELAAASSGASETQRQIFENALGISAANFRFLASEKSLAKSSNPELAKLFRDKKANILVLTASAKRVADLAESADFAARSPLVLQFHGTGRKQEQLSKMRKDIASCEDGSGAKFKTVIGVSARIARFVEDAAINLDAFALIAIDTTVDFKNLNTLSQRESKQALLDIFASRTASSFTLVLF